MNILSGNEIISFELDDMDEAINYADKKQMDGYATSIELYRNCIVVICTKFLKKGIRI